MSTMAVQASLRGQVSEARLKVERIDADLQAARRAVADLSARRNELDRELDEARIAEAMERTPTRPVAALKATLRDLEEELEAARAKVLGLERLRAEASTRVAVAETALRRREVEWFRERATALEEEMQRAARALQQSQYRIIALARALGKREGLQRDAGGLVPLHLIFAEIISSSGAGKHWPQMGDRKVDSSLLVAEFREIEDALEAF